MSSSASGARGTEGGRLGGARAAFVASLGRKVNDTRELALLKAREMHQAGALAAVGLGRAAPTLIYLPLLAGTLAVLYLATRGTAFRWWAVYLAGFGIFAGLRTLADETAIPWQYGYAVDLEQLGGTIHAPTIWLQDRLYDPDRTSSVDRATYAVYISYFLVPHLTAALVWSKARTWFPRYVLAMLATYFLGLAGSFLLPTAPPWLAAQEGHLAPVYRVIIDITNQVGSDASEVGYALSGSNVVAAMPSLHTAVTVLLAIFLASRGRLWGILGAAYAAAMSFSLVYLGEHYIIDLLAGLLTAVAGWRIGLALERRLVSRLPINDTRPIRIVPPHTPTRRAA